MPPQPISQSIRFHRHYIPEPNSGCWIWIGGTITSRNKLLYGSLGCEAPDRGHDLAHRVSYRIHKGHLSDDMQVDHTCNNTLCVNPDHLEIVDNGENTRRAHYRKHGNSCRRGHPYTKENTWIEKNGTRHCRRCHADIEARNRATKKRPQ